MSKKSQENNVPVSTPMDGRVIYDYMIQGLQGRLLTFIESLGLRESQEKSAKDIFRDIFYSLYTETIWIEGDKIGPVVQEAYDEARKLGQSVSNARFPAVGNSY